MMTATLLCGSVGIPTTAIFLPNSSKSYRPLSLPIQSCHRQLLLTTSSSRSSPMSSSVVSDSLRLLEWGKVCECVASFAGTQLGREAAKERLWSPGFSSYDESNRLLVETAAAVEMINCGIGGLDFRGIDIVSVKSAVESALRGFPLNGREALAVACIIQSAETLQVNLKVAFKEDSEWYDSFMPPTEMPILTVSRPKSTETTSISRPHGDSRSAHVLTKVLNSKARFSTSESVEAL